MLSNERYLKKRKKNKFHNSLLVQKIAGEAIFLIYARDRKLALAIYQKMYTFTKLFASIWWDNYRLSDNLRMNLSIQHIFLYQKSTSSILKYEL